mgnify:CR=1 FL=1
MINRYQSYYRNVKQKINAMTERDRKINRNFSDKKNFNLHL